MQMGWKDAQGAQVNAVGCPDCLKVWGKVVLKHRVQQVEVSKAHAADPDDAWVLAAVVCLRYVDRRAAARWAGESLGAFSCSSVAREDSWALHT